MALPAMGAPLQDLARDPSWLKLLHYEERVGRGLRSRAVNEEFFFSTSGTPEAELAAFAAAAHDPAARVRPFGRHPQCAFPARFAWLKTHVPANYPVVPCPEFETWQEQLDARGVRLVFASAFANNPASMFGHTMLKFTGGREKPALLDYAVTFLAATDPGDDAFSYTWKGLAGGYTASYQLDPYYMTVSLYTRGESRDLWEYELPLSDSARERLVMHLWEVLFQARFAYYFLDENCSYMLLALLEAAEPSWSWTQRQNLIVLPLETLRGLGPTLQSQPTFRPSSRRDLETAFARLNADERGVFFALSAKTEKTDFASASVPVLDALAASASHERFKKHMQTSAAENAAFNAILQVRAERGQSGPAPALAPPVQPLAGHRPRALMPGLAWENGQPAAIVRYRLGLHDFLNAPGGYESFAAIRYLDLGLRFDPRRKKLYVEDARLADVTSLRPWTRLTPEWSWHLALGADRVREPLCDTCVAVTGEAAGGLATNFDGQTFIGYLMGLYRHEVARVFDGQQRFGPGLLGGFAVATAPWRLHAEVRAISETWRPQVYRSRSGVKRSRTWRARYDLGQALTLTKDSDLRIEATFIPLESIGQGNYQDVRVSGVVFF